MAIKCKNFLFIGFFLFVHGHAKNAAVPAPVVTVIGKWQLVKQNLKLDNNGLVVGSVSKSKFTINDFVRYLSDGTS